MGGWGGGSPTISLIFAVSVRMINMVKDDTMLTYCDNVRFFLWLSRVFRKGDLHTKNYCLSIVTVAISDSEYFTSDCAE